MVYLVHHADAVGPEVDAQRPLSAAGRAHAEALARECAARGVAPQAVWHSGKLRARQTAESFWRLCNPLATFEAIRGLQPGDPPAWIRDRLLEEDRDVMIVGHMPHLPAALALLTADTNAIGFPPHGIVALEADGGRWKERWRLAGSCFEPRTSDAP
jgi:phosphohistidine phosphatase